MCRRGAVYGVRDAGFIPDQFCHLIFLSLSSIISKNVDEKLFFFSCHWVEMKWSAIMFGCVL